MSYNLRRDPAPSGRGLFGAAGPIAAANEVAATLFPGGSRYETQKACAARLRAEASAMRGSTSSTRGVLRGRGKVTKQRQPVQTPRQQQPSQSSLPTPPTDKTQRDNAASETSSDSSLDDDIP